MDIRLCQTVRGGQCGPGRGIVGHLSRQRPHVATEGHGLDIEPRRDPAPHPAPPEHIAVDHVERLVGGGRCLRGPQQVPRQQPGIGHVGQPLPLGERTGELERAPGVPAQARVHGQGRAHVHRIAHRRADHRVRAMHAPLEAIAGGGGKHLVLLRVVEVVHGQARLLFTEGRLRQVALRVRLERAEVVLQARHQRYVLHRARGLKRAKQVTHHRAVHPDVLGLVGLPGPGSDEHVRGCQSGQRGARGLRIVQVGTDAVGAGGQRIGPTGQAVNFPALLQQPLYQCTAHDARCTDHQRFLPHDVASFIALQAHTLGYRGTPRKKAPNGNHT